MQILMKLGLSEKEAKVYLAALELGEDTVQNIARKAKINRATTYVILEKLMKLGLMSTHQDGKRTVFVAEDPHELVNIIDEEKRTLEQRQRELETSMDQLLAIYNARKDKPSVRYFEGADGLEALDRYGHDQFKKKSQMVGLIPIGIIENQFPKRRATALSERVKLGINSKMLYTRPKGDIPDAINKRELRQAIRLPEKDFPIDVTIQIYSGWGVKFFNFKDDDYFGVLIKDANIARNMQYLFDLAWKGAHVKK